MARPAGVTILGILGIVGGGFAFLTGAVIFLGSAIVTRFMQGLPRFFVGVGAALIGGFLVCYAVVHVAAGIGLLKLANWARVLTMVLVSIQLAVTALTLFSGMPFLFFAIAFQFRRLIIFGVDVLILWYLSQPDVRRAFVQPPVS